MAKSLVHVIFLEASIDLNLAIMSVVECLLSVMSQRSNWFLFCVLIVFYPC